MNKLIVSTSNLLIQLLDSLEKLNYSLLLKIGNLRNYHSSINI